MGKIEKKKKRVTVFNVISKSKLNCTVSFDFVFFRSHEPKKVFVSL